jgi:hypothetical protein
VERERIDDDDAIEGRADPTVEPSADRSALVAAGTEICATRVCVALEKTSTWFSGTL